MNGPSIIAISIGNSRIHTGLFVNGQLESDEMLMFSTDYPHWHFDSAEEAVPQGFSESLLEKILRENARAWYRL